MSGFCSLCVNFSNQYFIVSFPAPSLPQFVKIPPYCPFVKTKTQTYSLLDRLLEVNLWLKMGLKLKMGLHLNHNDQFSWILIHGPIILVSLPPKATLTSKLSISGSQCQHTDSQMEEGEEVGNQDPAQKILKHFQTRQVENIKP